MFMHYILRTLIFQPQYLMKVCKQLVIDDTSKYLFTLINEEQKFFCLFGLSFFTPHSNSTDRQLTKCEGSSRKEHLGQQQSA